MLTLVKSEIDESAEEGDICSRHLLASEDDARVNLGLHELFILVHVHLCATYTVPQVLEPLHLILCDGVFVLVDVYQGIANSSDIVRECWH